MPASTGALMSIPLTSTPVWSVSLVKVTSMSRFLFRYFRPEHLNPRLDRQSRRAVRKKISYVTVDIIFELNYRGHAQNCCAYTLKPADPERLDPVLRKRGSQNEGVTTLARTKSLSKQTRQAREGKGFTVA